MKRTGSWDGGPNRDCPKCGSHTVSVRYRELGTVQNAIGEGVAIGVCPQGIGEHLLFTCKTCGYKWAESPLDAKTKRTADEDTPVRRLGRLG